ncbi:DUF433 domain-containing protein [Leptospira neocaledonica]|uniref:DUF433 domain-containing protein n=1 Tax=Leptospira neocaledonica TaxID=2023192 RepID=A0A2N0A1G8_9LEPT|nr:DUF433 domain-containing protein [Leptospira neocaledonica]PJZ78108.1 hypothetical protein CH365_06750 [Leptospira neocaledonica]
MATTANQSEFSYLGKGIYSVSEASRLSNVSPQRIFRWVRGYNYGSALLKIRMEPIWNRDYTVIEKHYSLSFQDLIEIRFINAFRTYGISWRTIRAAAIRAAQILEISHPFSTKRFYTDRKTILLRVAKESENIELIDLAENQYAIDEILTPHLYEGLDFSELDVAQRWWPIGRQKHVVIDPNRNFGKPIVENYNIPTETIFSLYKNNPSSKSIADWFEIEEEYIKHAIEFEKSIA